MYRGRRIAALVLARLGSSRLPGKMLLPFGRDSVLSTVLERLQASRLIDEILVATTEESLDDSIATAARELGFPVTRGSSEDVVARMTGSLPALAQPADVIVRGCADNPLVMPSVVDDGVRTLVDSGADLITPFEHATYPFGFGLVSMTTECLRRIDAEAEHPAYREHVENYCFEHPDAFEVLYQQAPPSHHYPELNATLDYRVDYDRLMEFERVLRDVPIEEQGRHLVEHVRSARVWIEGRSRTAPEGVDLILATRSPGARAPRGVVVVDRFQWDGATRRGLRYDGTPEPVYLDPIDAPDDTDVEFLHRATRVFLPALLAGPVRPLLPPDQDPTHAKFVHPEQRTQPREGAS